MSVVLANDPTRTGRSRIDWWAREAELVQQLRIVSDRTQKALGAVLTLPTVEWDVPWRAAELVSSLTHACLGELRRIPRDASSRAQEMFDLIMDLQQLAMDWYLHDTAMRGQRLADCAAGLARLRTLPSSAALADSVCEEVVLRCGFHRAVLSKVESRSWKPLILHHRGGKESQPWFADWINQRVPLTDTAPEAEMLSRRRPMLVYDTADAPVYRPLIVQAGQSRSYALAPLVVGQNVVGFLHTDHHPLARRVDESDRDVLWAFADGFSHIYERAMLTEQLRAQRDSVRELFFGAVDRLDELCESTSERMSGSADAAVDDHHSPVVDLTDREAEVFELLLTGATNQAIADRLVISEGTVKSHVKHILRKYGAVNRAQAIAWALRDR
jgi:DNA-binding CsgD family transcriptional regulator/GAF domain-containing protein